MSQTIGEYWKARFRQELDKRTTAKIVQQRETGYYGDFLSVQAEAAFDAVATEMADAILANIKAAQSAIREIADKRAGKR